MEFRLCGCVTDQTPPPHLGGDVGNFRHPHFVASGGPEWRGQVPGGYPSSHRVPAINA